NHAPARAGSQGDLVEGAAQDVVAGVAAVAVHVVAPAEGVAGVARLRGAALLLELSQHRQGGPVGRLGSGRFGGGRCRGGRRGGGRRRRGRWGGTVRGLRARRLVGRLRGGRLGGLLRGR